MALVLVDAVLSITYTALLRTRIIGTNRENFEKPVTLDVKEHNPFRSSLEISRDDNDIIIIHVCEKNAPAQ